MHMPSEKIHRLGSRCNRECGTRVPRPIAIDGSCGSQPSGIAARQLADQELTLQKCNPYFKGKIESYRRGEAAAACAVIPTASIKVECRCYLRQ